jgi:Tfp pilus assembly PilM family ATPase
MARIIAIDWDRHEARCVVASAAGGRLRILTARSVRLVDWTEGGESRPDVVGSLRAVLDDTRAGRAVVLVGVDRANVELMNLTLPPAKPGELPQLVAMQVFRESQTAEDDAIVDFAPFGEPGEPGEDRQGVPSAQPTQVMAAVLSKVQMEKIRAACSGAGVKPSRILLRPLAAASLFARRVSPTERVCLLVSPVGNEADLVVLMEGRVVFQRTVRLPDEVGEEPTAQRLAGEIRRTLMVAQQGPLAANPVERVFVFGGSEEHQQLTEIVAADLGVTVSVVDPFEITDVPDDGPTERPGRFAALVGMILDESYGAHAVDFLHPKRPPPPVDRRRIVVAAVAAAVLAVVAVGYYAWSEVSAADEEVQRLTAELKARDDLLKRTTEPRQLVDAIHDWQSGEVIWLDELRDLSLRFPSGRELIVQRMTMASDRSGGGGIEFNGTMRDQEVINRMEQNVRDQYHEVRSKRVQERDQGKGYPWVFETSMSVAGRDKESYVEQQAVAR